MMMRMGAVGRSKEGRCAFDVTQTDLSEAVGLTPVHVNRSLQDLRKRGLISFAKGVLTIHDWDGLADLGDFRSDYLHLADGRAR
jgi:CRP-like cAMP-binding protein